MTSATPRSASPARHRGRPRRRTFIPGPRLPERIIVSRPVALVVALSALAVTISGWTTLAIAH